MDYYINNIKTRGAPPPQDPPAKVASLRYGLGMPNFGNLNRMCARLASRIQLDVFVFLRFSFWGFKVACLAQDGSLQTSESPTSNLKTRTRGDAK